MHLRPARRRRALAVLLAAAAVPVLGLALAQPASAHDRLLSSDPADGATVDETPAELTLVFSADVLAAGAQVAVTTADGTVPAEVTVDGDEAVAALPDDLPGGDWDVSWRVVSSDGHPIEGELAFTVASAATPSPSASPSSSPTSSPTMPSASPSPTASPDATTTAGHAHGGGTPGVDLNADGEAGWATAWLFPVAVLAVVGVAAAVLLQRRRRADDGARDADGGDETGERHGPDAGPDGDGPTS
ncbi:copper resistance protein CopC [Isoptericola sp. NPDC056573]|uniref:copper resistance CopC family protein n=1 Tax=Isoptericola sp. NPDC056573 TaxID=3345868 RepID=UPI0036974E74